MAWTVWYPVKMYQLDPDMIHVQPVPVHVPVPAHGCLALSVLRQYFPTATSLHFIFQRNLVSVSHSIPHLFSDHEMLNTRGLVFHLPKSFHLSSFLVSCGDLLANTTGSASNQKCDVSKAIQRVNAKLRAKCVMVDCAHLVMRDLLRLEQLIDLEPDQVLRVLERFFPEDNKEKKVVDSESVSEESDECCQVDVPVPVIVSRPKLVTKLSQVDVHDTYLNMSSGEKKAVAGDIVSLRPKLVVKRILSHHPAQKQ